MSNLQNNTTDLQSILDAVNALPDKTDLTPIVEALIDKGQTVPNDAGVDELADLIAAIEAGGGSGGDIDSLADRTIKEYSSTLVNKVGDYVFRGCSALTEVNLPKVTTVGTYAFHGCSALTEVNLPKVTTVGTSAFGSCSALEAVDLPELTFVSASAFAGCTKLRTIVLRGSTLCTLANSNILNNTPLGMTGEGGTVYVPAALVESYKTATGWKTLYSYGTCTFAAIEGSEYE